MTNHFRNDTHSIIFFSNHAQEEALLNLIRKSARAPQSDIMPNLNEIMKVIIQRVKEFSPQLSGTDTDYSEIECRTSNVNKRTYPSLSFFRTERGDSKAVSTFNRVCLIPYGGKGARVPPRINEYLQDAILVTFGESLLVGEKSRNLSQFGSLDLFTLVTANTKSLQHDLFEAYNTSLRQKEDRLLESATVAESRLQKMNQGLVPDKYSPKDFETHVFFLLKRIFPLSERWGREGKRETDGLILFATDNDQYHAFGYDPKLSRGPNGYDLRAEEHNKAVYYILDKNTNDEVHNVTRGEGLRAHILVSNNFREEQLKNFTNSVNNWFELIEGDFKKNSCPILFLSVGSLLSLYQIFIEQWEYIKGSSDFHDRFYKYLVTMLAPKIGSGYISSATVDEFRAKVVSLRGSMSYSGPLA